MKPKSKNILEDDLRPDYDFDFDFAKVRRGRYAGRLKAEGSNLVLVEPELARAFPDSAAVNAALRSVVEIARLSAGLARPESARPAKRRAA